MIRVSALNKAFGSLQVLKELDLEIATGGVTALVGHNGSGKTTLIKCLLGLDRSDSGTIHIAGRQLDGSSEYRAEIGYMPQITSFPENLTARELLAMICELNSDRPEHQAQLTAYFRLEDDLDKPLKVLSGGTRQKVNAVMAFMFDPQLLILDEPTAGLDPSASAALKDRILSLRGEGRTFLITSHLMSDLEEIADAVIFLSDGQIVYSGSPAELLEETGASTLERAVAALMESER